jgi:hypothetical protein
MSDSMASPEDLKGHLGWERSAQAWGLASELARLRMALDDVRALRGKIQGSSDHRFFTLSVPQGWSRQQAIDNVPSSVLINALQKSAYKALTQLKCILPLFVPRKVNCTLHTMVNH